MGLFGRKERNPVEHPTIDRSLLVEAPLTTIEGHVEEYGKLMGRGARALETRVSTSGPWVRIDLPPDGVHPWELHNLAYWFADIGTVVAVSAAGLHHAAYHLVWVDDASTSSRAGPPMAGASRSASRTTGSSGPISRCRAR